MAPRPRTSTDAELLTAAIRAVSRIGPARVTLADVAAEAGVSPATLVQRFGSKRGLLLAMVKGTPATVPGEFANLRAAHASPLAALRAVGDCMAGMAPSPQELANHLIFLHMDLTDPDFHRHALDHAHAFQGEMIALLDAAVAAGELKTCDTAGMARLMSELLHGSLVSWAIYREGTAQEWVRRDLDLLLAPYIRRRRGRPAS